MKYSQHTASVAVGEYRKEKKAAGPVRATLSGYIDLMKPHVTVLLLGTTVAAMAIAKQGLPPLGLVFATLLGGAMSAGSANCINCYIDRDIDQIMRRTQRRSLPSGRVQPAQALLFGLALGIGSFVILAVFVNEKASIPMLPVVMGERETRKQILLYSLLLLAVTMVLFAMRAMGLFYLVCALVLGGILVYMAVRLIRDSSKKWARTLFWYSNCYLAMIFAVMVIDRVIH